MKRFVVLTLLLQVLVNSSLSASVKKAADIKKNAKTIFLTFDDGPKEGTTHLLDILKQFNVSATFFLNSFQLENGNTENHKALIRLVNEGHVLGDHSYDHMNHNTKDGSPRNVYIGVEDDLKWFGAKNSDPVKDVLKAAGFNNQVVSDIINKMDKIIRMPYTNNWRVGDIHHDCVECTIPVISGRNGIRLADAMKADGSQVFGWDHDWKIDYRGRYAHSGEKTLSLLDFDAAKIPGKVIILSHDTAHRSGSGGHLNGVNELEDFILRAKFAGYNFATLDAYHH